MPVQTILLGIIPPVVIALAILAAAWRPWSVRPARWATWGSALALAGAYAVTDALIHRGLPTFPPGEDHRWLFWLAFPVAIAATAAGRRRGGRVHAGVGAAIMLLAFAAMASGLVLSRDTALRALVGVVIYAVLARMIWAGIAAAAERHPGPRVPLVLWTVAAGAALVFVQSYMLKAAQLAGAMAVVMGVFAVLGFVRPKLTPVRAAAPVFAFLLVGLLFGGRLYVPIKSAVLVCLSAMAAELGELGRIRRLPRWAGTLICMLSAAACSAAAIALTPEGFDFGET